MWLIVMFTFGFSSIPAWATHSGEISVLYEPSYCAIDEYFNINQLKCIACDSEKNLVPSESGKETFLRLLSTY